MKKVLIGIAAFVIIAVGYETIFPEPDDSANEQAAIQVIKQSYTPSIQLLSWNPDFNQASWVARKQNGPLCESHGVDDDCYEVEVWLDVIPPNGEKKRLTVDWLVYAGDAKYQAENTEARTLFVEH
jgi:hypothetical protein